MNAYAGRSSVTNLLDEYRRLTHHEGRFYNRVVLTIEKAEARRGARLSRAERATVTVADPCEPDLGNSSGGSGA